MSATLESLSDLVSNETSGELDAALGKIKHCVDQLTDDQVWWRPSDSMNSVANLLLHLCGNLGQWIVSGVGGAADVRERQKEFDQRSQTLKTELMQQIESAVADAKMALSETSAEELLRIRPVQGNDVTGMQAILHSVAHFRGHAQEIVHMTRCQLGDSYEFDFVPPTSEQGDASVS
tara:strand:- start:578 stop:1108 length:531 start_codon:yes stop_codon:yes gene_type:complete